MKDQNPRIFPSWRYHKELGAKVIHNQAQHDLLESEGGWFDTPAAFEEEKKVEPVSELDQKLAALGAVESEDVQPDPESEPDEEAIRAELLERGVSKKSLKGKTLEELKAMLEG